MDESVLQHTVDASTRQGGGFTCQTCSVAFNTPDLQRTHYQSDWHRYNLKRRVANLTSVSATTFAEKVLAQKSLAATTAERANFAERCGPCGKVYYSENAYANHLGSRKHKEAVRQALAGRDPQDVDSVDGSAVDSAFTFGTSIEPSQASIYESSTASPVPEKPESEEGEDGDRQRLTEDEEAQIRQKLENAVKLPLGECLFCRTVQKDEDEVEALSANVTHMIKMHSLFLPEQDYLVDLRGLIEYLQTKVAVGNFCLACNKGFRNIEACRAHMASVSHRRIAYTTEDEQMELSDFYDFSATWEGIPEAKSDGEWSDVEGDEAENEEDDDDDAAYDSDETIDSAHLEPVEEDFELRLPSGAVAGHRSLQRYYRQNLRGRDPFAERGGAAVHKAIMDRTQQVRQELVNTSIAGVDKGRKAWSRKHIATFQDMRIREDFKTRTMYRNNNQKHYRDPLLQ